jgi:hypothetical protein
MRFALIRRRPTMHHFRGKLLQGDRTRLDPANVYMDYHPTGDGAAEGWDGYLLVESETAVEPGGAYTLRLVDGRSGALRISAVAPDDSGKVRATFVGEGDLR